MEDEDRVLVPMTRVELDTLLRLTSALENDGGLNLKLWRAKQDLKSLNFARSYASHPSQGALGRDDG